MAKNKFVHTRVDYNTKEHFSVLTNQFCSNESEMLNDCVKKFCNPKYYDPKGIFNRKEYLTEIIRGRIDEDSHNLLAEVSKKYNLKISVILREVIHESIRENHTVVKRGMIQKFKGIDKI